MAEATTTDPGPAPEAELRDPDVLSDDELDRLTVGATWRRFVVVGDSVAKGVGDASPGYRDMTWGERVAATLERANPGLAYLNLGTRKQTAAEIRDTQLEKATAFDPDLVGYVGGGNDLLVEEFQIEPVAAAIEETIAALAGTGATVITYSMFNLPAAFDIPGFDELERRLQVLNSAVEEIGAAHGTLHVDLYSLPCCADPGLYSSDMQHGTMRGQAIVATETVRRLAELIPARSGE